MKKKVAMMKKKKVMKMKKIKNGSKWFKKSNKYPLICYNYDLLYVECKGLHACLNIMEIVVIVPK